MSLREIFGPGPCVILGFVIDGEEQLMQISLIDGPAARELHEALRARIERVAPES